MIKFKLLFLALFCLGVHASESEIREEVEYKLRILSDKTPLYIQNHFHNAMRELFHQHIKQPYNLTKQPYDFIFVDYYLDHDKDLLIANKSLRLRLRYKVNENTDIFFNKLRKRVINSNPNRAELQLKKYQMNSGEQTASESRFVFDHTEKDFIQLATKKNILMLFKIIERKKYKNEPISFLNDLELDGHEINNITLLTTHRSRFHINSDRELGIGQNPQHTLLITLDTSYVHDAYIVRPFYEIEIELERNKNYSNHSKEYFSALSLKKDIFNFLKKRMSADFNVVESQHSKYTEAQKMIEYKKSRKSK